MHSDAAAVTALRIYINNTRGKEEAGPLRQQLRLGFLRLLRRLYAGWFTGWLVHGHYGPGSPAAASCTAL